LPPPARAADKLSARMNEQAGKYARFEFERRFLVEHLPDDVVRGAGWRVTDRYIQGTRLRLRRMEPLGGGATLFKLGQKDVPAPPDFSRMTITNIYLSPDEYDVFAVLPARELRKRRHLLEEDGRTYGVDVFEGHLAGLILAEVGFETSDEMNRPWHRPRWIAREVSGDIRFTGGALASLTRAEAATLLRQVLRER
jgi:CYTH domain-containing protein